MAELEASPEANGIDSQIQEKVVDPISSAVKVKSDSDDINANEVHESNGAVVKDEKEEEKSGSKTITFVFYFFVEVAVRSNQRRQISRFRFSWF